MRTRPPISNERAAVLLVRDQPDGDATRSPAVGGASRARPGGAVVPDARYVWLEGGFEKGRLYQIAYTAIGAPVIGSASPRCATAPPGSSTGPRARATRRPTFSAPWYAYGRSQTGRLLRTLVYNDLNLDEQGREALDGIIANVAGGLRGEFNQRFGQNSKDRPHMMDYVQPATDEDLHRRLAAPREQAEGVLHEQLGRVSPRRCLARPHERRGHTRRPVRRVGARLPLRGQRARLGAWPPTPRSSPRPIRPSRRSIRRTCGMRSNTAEASEGTAVASAETADGGSRRLDPLGNPSGPG